MEWTDDKLATLTRLWNVEKRTQAQCAEALGCSVNAIAGKTHRLGLERRPSPIKRTPGVPPKNSYARRKQAKAMSPFEIERRRLAAENRVAPKPTPKQEVRVVYLGRVTECCWPIGKRLECGAPSVPNKPYCDAHCAKAYKDWQPRRTAAVVSEAGTPAVSVDDSSLDLPDASDGVGHLLGETRVQDHAEAA